MYFKISLLGIAATLLLFTFSSEVNAAPLEMTVGSIIAGGELYPSSGASPYSKSRPFIRRFNNQNFNLESIEDLNSAHITDCYLDDPTCPNLKHFQVKSRQKTVKTKQQNYHLLIMKAFDPNQGALPADTEIEREDDEDESTDENRNWHAPPRHKIRMLAGMYIAKSKQTPPIGYCLVQQQTTTSPYPEINLSQQAQQSLATIRAWPLSQRIKVKAQHLPAGYSLKFYERKDGEMVEIYGFLETPGETFMVLDSYFPPALEKDVLKFAKRQILAHIHRGWKFFK